MMHRTYVPSRSVAEFVGLVWYHEGFDLPHGRELHFPTGTVELVLNLGTGAAVLCGPFSVAAVVETAQRSCLLGIQFRPGGAFGFLAPPMQELRNLRVPLDDVWREGATELRERVLAAPGVDARFAAVERFLSARIACAKRPHPAVAFAVERLARAGPERAVAATVERTGLSQQHLIRLFSRQVGLTPKLFHRLMRFHRALDVANRLETDGWAGAAVRCGYFDQAHLIRDFRQFTGLTPAVWHARSAGSPVGVPLSE